MKITHHLNALILLGVVASGVAQGSNYDPPPPEDVDAWIEYHDMPIFSDVFALNCDDERISKEAVAEVLVMSDTVFELSEIHPALSGELAFDWEPIYHPIEVEKSEWNVIGTQSFQTLCSDCDTARVDLEDVIYGLEAWDHPDGIEIGAKRIEFVDINFDGFPDIRLKSSGRSPNLAYFLYDPEVCAFASNPDLHHTNLYSFDCARGIYNNYQGGTGWTNVQETMALDPLTGQIRPVLSAYQVNLVNDPNTDREVAWSIIEYSRFVDGEQVLIRRDSIPYRD